MTTATALVVAASATSYATSGNANPVNVLVQNGADKPVPVAGSVDVSNLPGTQDVSGTVDVGNFPSSQSVTGTVGVSNFPDVQQVRGVIGVTGPVTTVPASRPVAFHRHFNLPHAEDYVVPEGQQLRLRTVRGLLVTKEGWLPDIDLIICPDENCNGNLRLSVPLDPTGGLAGGDLYEGTILVDVLLPPGHRIRPHGTQTSADRNTLTTAAGTVVLFGELEPVD